MEESRDREGRVTLANWKRLLKLHFIIRMLGKDGTFCYVVYKEKYKKRLTEIGFEVIRILGKTWGKKSKKIRATSFSEESGSEDDSNLTQEEEDDVTVAASNCAKDKNNHDWEEEEGFPLSIAVSSVPSCDEPLPVLISDPARVVVSKSTNEHEGGNVGAEFFPSPKPERGDYHTESDGKGIAREEQDARVLVNQVRALIESCKSPRLNITRKEEEWYDSIWNYDWNGKKLELESSDEVLKLGRPLEMPGIPCDKTISGEYILGKPPKKPGV